jgi:hypothetical protein
MSKFKIEPHILGHSDSIVMVMESDASNVPEELMKRLHDANARLHDARLGVERTMDDSEYRHRERLNEAEEHLQQVEKELEEIDEAIKTALHPKRQTDGS